MNRPQYYSNPSLALCPGNMAISLLLQHFPYGTYTPRSPALPYNIHPYYDSFPRERPETTAETRQGVKWRQ
ncbi:unnamed protein product [Tuber melanosporum]|uniref:(Perigord truffle) hypothetical protein n=1 Tax=Tuber melanosporum (strain Mel28) TaxID=656061 RepID=D5G9P1_TUBMM|nr:uncharacterized protein GSTUM_00005002001 [Tuber melanosporum]CAZ81234.1 unnamed protein product [Tuber melanosporum]